MDAFQWLNGQLAEHVAAYLRSLLGQDHGLVAHIQKAWPVVCARNGGTVDLHSHRNAYLSAVFYVLKDLANESGELEFEAPDDYFSHVMAIPLPRRGGLRWGVRAAAPPSSAVPFGPAPSGAPLRGKQSPLFGLLRPGHHHGTGQGTRDANTPSDGLGSPRQLRARPERIPPARVHP